MPDQDRSSEEARVSARYFGGFVDDYHQAFSGGGANPLHRLINRLFRRRTFVLRTSLVEQALRAHGVAGKTVLDLGCGSGEVSLVAARLGARVIGLDIVPGMVAIARREAAAAGLADATDFSVANIFEGPLPAADVAMLVGVIEYYSDLDALLGRVCATTRELVLIVDTRGPLWRRTLRYLLARLKRFYLYYRNPSEVARVMAAHGFREAQRVAGHSYSFFAFRR